LSPALLLTHTCWPEAGCDEAGRGCLAGPVFGAAVILPPDYFHDGLNDSKKLTEKERERLRIDIEKDAVAWAVQRVNENEIDKINILNASIRAMQKSLSKLQSPFEHIIVDGNRFKKFQDIPHTCIVKGDGKYLSIAAASILAKTHRDEYMAEIHKEFPEYLWIENKGYPTKKHRRAIHDYGPCKYHRRSFRLLPNPIQFNLFENDQGI